MDTKELKIAVAFRQALPIICCYSVAQSFLVSENAAIQRK